MLTRVLLLMEEQIMFIVIMINIQNSDKYVSRMYQHGVIAPKIRDTVIIAHHHASF